ncbi:MAG TPA: hypothetical protein VGX91_07975 [Candidatus Cybelea sp.]|jgi:hypothetical protein|nr:hypothetical protein [Candidatus Cybelea sp.]
MAEIRFERKLRVPAELAAQVLGEMLHAIARQEGPWRGFALHITLGDLRLPDVGYVAIPISLTVERSSQSDAFDITFHAARLPTAFPDFKGTMGAQPGELGESTLYLAGSYSIPMNVFGKLIDGALMPHAAQRSLENFVEEIAAAAQARVDKREADYARYSYFAGNPVG